MPCPHNEITIVQRSQRQSAVAAAAYQSGEKLFCEYDQQVKHYPEKRGIVHNEILLPANAPQEYADRNTLWNAAEAVEKQWNSQLARRWVLTIPREIPPDQYAVLVREFCQKQFVSKGMIADFAIHDTHPPGHNPHAHVLLTMRAMDKHGKWLPKSRKVYDLDENGERIKLPSGRWKSHKEDTVDWNDQKYCEIWRHEWEVIQNRYLEANDRPERVDLRSYARQGLDIVPTVHEGAAVRQMEKRGIQTNIGNLNREIRAANRLMKSIRQLIQNLKGWITELGEERKELLAQKAAEEATLLPNLLMKYMEIRKEERKDWTRAGQNRGTSQDLKAVSEALSYLRQKGLSTVEDLEAFLESSGKSAADYRSQMKPKEARSKVIDRLLASRTDCKECKPAYEKYQKIFFKKTKEKFKQEHSEVARYEKAAAYLAKHPDDKDSTQKELQQELETLLSEIAELKVPLTEVQEDLKKLRDIRYWVRKATPGTEESKEPPKKQPIKEVLQDKADEKKAQRTAPAQTKHKQQNMEL
jgi:ATP-dependent exoDNAse (exonuclease V) alpha subunit